MSGFDDADRKKAGALPYDLKEGCVPFAEWERKAFPVEHLVRASGVDSTRTAGPTAGMGVPSAPASMMEAAPRTDLGNAERLIEFATGNIRFHAKAKKWLVWDGMRWQLDDEGKVLALAGQMVRQLREMADARGADKLARFALSSEKEARLKAMVSLAQSQPGIPVQPDALDANPMLLNVLNGTVDLRTGKLLPYDKTNLITKLAPVEYSETAPCPKWLAFLDRIMGGNRTLIDFLQRVSGYSLTGSTSEQAFFIFHGAGANGKSTFIEALRGFMGDYAQATDFSTFLQRKSEAIRNDIARLVGARFVSAVEPEENRTLSESLIKQLTGDDRVTARFLFKEFFEFLPSFKIILAANHKPNINGVDHGIWRRVKLVPFTVTIPEAERDKDLRLKLREEQAGILRWAVEGCLMWQHGGLKAPPEVTAATDDYRSEMDVMGEFIDAVCEVGEAHRTKAGDLHTAYASWAEDTGNDSLTAKALAVKLTAKGFVAKKSGGQRYWVGMRLRRPPRGDAWSPPSNEGGADGADGGGSSLPF